MILGRKVFFIRPHSVIQNELLTELIRQEYDVAILTDHTRVRDLFRLHPECIAFLNIDEGWEEPEWEALVREVKKDPDLAEVRLGIVTYHPDPELSHKYLLELEVPCGYIKLTLGLEESTKTILKVLEANEARGRRQFLRVPCRPGTAQLNIPGPQKPLKGTLLDLSSVGMACVFDFDPAFVARSLVKDIQLKLKGVLCTVSAVVMGTRPKDDATVYILLFDPKTPEEVREKIRGFLRKSLQANLEEDLISLQA